MVSTADQTVITVEALPADLMGNHPVTEIPVASTDEPIDEKTQVMQALEQAGGNKTRAAQQLGLTRAGFYKKLKRLGL